MSYDPQDAIARLMVWDVVYPLDRHTDPAKHKMWVCVSRANLWFLRISTLKYTDQCVRLTSYKHPYLTYDSYFGAGGDLITTPEIELEMLLGKQHDPVKQGIVGCIHTDTRAVIIDALSASPKLTPSQLRKILEELR